MVEEEVLGFLGKSFRERERDENSYFSVVGCIYNLKISLSELLSLSETPFLALTATFHAKRITSSGRNCT